ncbi:hypothetical protein FIBSPDRAFT_959496 [Athelia psychrophila]|uniref:Rhodopsin domain-containing protein n=1 Tax=Athelia psychrophila TaxID=1759441 RepID=A0A166DGC9_9AGAM|nr:hypothetical protein FIBSPDRAFT_959496 [Fibularhizoctonia sp. CBS 109695]
MSLHVRTEHIPQPSLLAAQVVSTVFPCLAIAITAFRLVIQYRRSQLWWEDFWAAVAMTCTIGVVSEYWWYSIIVAKPHPDTYSFMVSWYLFTLTLTSGLWAARMSLTFSIIRLAHPSSRLRIAANLTAGLCACCFASQIVQKMYICRDVKSWMNNTVQGCEIGASVGITETSMDIVSDLLLIALASYLLQDARQLKSQRKLIRGLFSASILTTLSSIAHMIFVVGPEVLLTVIMTAYLELSVSLIVCNLPVVVTFFYRHFKRTHADDTCGCGTSSSECSTSVPLESTPDASAVTQTGSSIYSADLMETISTQSTNTFDAQKSTLPEVASAAPCARRPS